MPVLKPNRGNKTFPSRLTRWVDRLLPFEFEVVHVARRTLGMADHLSRHSSELEGASIKAETLWNEWFTVNGVISLNIVLENGELTSEQAEAAKRVNEINFIKRVAKANLKKPIRTRDERNSRDKSKKHCTVTTRVSKMSDKIPSTKLLDEKLLPANYVADKLIQKVISLVKTYNRTGVSRLPFHGGKNSNPFRSTRKTYYTWIPARNSSIYEINDYVFLALWPPRPRFDVSNDRRHLVAADTPLNY